MAYKGLTVDDEDLYESRVKLWKNFNHAWLGLLAKQKEMMWSSKALHRSQSLISFEDLQKMAQELIRLCDGIERFGLVDYEYGVWEERIMTSEWCISVQVRHRHKAPKANGDSSHRMCGSLWNGRRGSQHPQRRQLSQGLISLHTRKNANSSSVPILSASTKYQWHLHKLSVLPNTS